MLKLRMGINVIVLFKFDLLQKSKVQIEKLYFLKARYYF